MAEEQSSSAPAHLTCSGYLTYCICCLCLQFLFFCVWFICIRIVLILCLQFKEEEVGFQFVLTDVGVRSRLVAFLRGNRR